MPTGVIHRYFADRDQLNHIVSDFRFLVRMIRRSGGEYDLQLREGYFNVYCRGSSLANVSPSRGGQYSVRVHRRYLQGRILESMSRYCSEEPYGGRDDESPNIRFHVQPARLREFFQLKHLRALASNIARVNYSEEIAFEQVLMTDNPASDTLVIIDRQVGDHSFTRQMDLLALSRGSTDEPFHFVVIEVKLGKNPELKVRVGRQLSDYVAHVREHIRDYVDCYRENYRQKKLMKLFDETLPDEIEIEERVEGVVVTGGYSQLAEIAKKELEGQFNIRVQVMKNVIGVV